MIDKRVIMISVLLFFASNITIYIEFGKFTQNSHAIQFFSSTNY